jgi:hypothetical protein
MMNEPLSGNGGEKKAPAGVYWEISGVHPQAESW